MEKESEREREMIDCPEIYMHRSVKIQDKIWDLFWWTQGTRLLPLLWQSHYHISGPKPRLQLFLPLGRAVSKGRYELGYKHTGKIYPTICHWRYAVNFWNSKSALEMIWIYIVMNPFIGLLGRHLRTFSHKLHYYSQMKFGSGCSLSDWFGCSVLLSQ